MANIFDSFNTPSWAETLVIGQIEKFSDLQLRVMKIFIDDELERREKEESDSTPYNEVTA